MLESKEKAENDIYIRVQDNPCCNLLLIDIINLSNGFGGDATDFSEYLKDKFLK